MHNNNNDLDIHIYIAGSSGDRIPVGVRFSAPVQTGPGGPPDLHKRSCVFPGGKAARACRLPPTSI
jgi:hypothetical protein